MARLSDSKLVHLALAVTLVAIVPCSSATTHSSSRSHHEMKLYVHESLVPPSTFIVSASPSGNATGADAFGMIRTLSNVLRSGKAGDSIITGSQVGILVVGISGNVYLSFTYFLNENATYQGTIAVQGHIDGTSQTERVFAVVGGTGDFQSVKGIDKVGPDAVNPPDPSDVVMVHSLTLWYPN